LSRCNELVLFVFKREKGTVQVFLKFGKQPKVLGGTYLVKVKIFRALPEPVIQWILLMGCHFRRRFSTPTNSKMEYNLKNIRRFFLTLLNGAQA